MSNPIPPSFRRFARGSRLAFIAALIFSGIVCALPFLPPATTENSGYVLEIGIASKYDVVAQVFWDTGAGIDATDTTVATVSKSDGLVPARFPMRAGRHRALRFDPINAVGEASFGPARVLDRAGKLIREFPVARFSVLHDVADVSTAGNVLRFRAIGGDPNFALDLDGLELKPTIVSPWRERLAVMAVSVAVILALALAIELSILDRRLHQCRPWFRRSTHWLQARPTKSVLLGAAVATILACYPLVFLGRSLVTPAFGMPWLYSAIPGVPGGHEVRATPTHGSDVAAMIWFDVPYASVQRRALFEHGELPLWNRFNDSGNPLFAQGQSMFGDPFQFITILADSAAWVWDVRFILARFLFAAGLGLCVWRLTRNAAAAHLIALSAPFFGFFLFRVNHPATFSLCYGPWILLSWTLIAERRPDRRLIPSLGLWVLANWTVLNSGTVKEAYFLGLTLNFAGALLLFFTPGAAAERRRTFAVMAAMTVSFALLSAPVWLNFLHTLAHSATAYDQPYALQIPPPLLLGFFDEIFYRASQPLETVLDPAANIFVLIGLLSALAQFRRLWAEPAGKALGLTSLASALLVFGIVPAAWITRVPFLGNVGHIANTFSCVLIVLVTILSGFGWTYAIAWVRERRAWKELISIALMAGLMLANYLGAGQAQFDLEKPKLLSFSPFFVGYVFSVVAASAVFFAAARVATRRSSWAPAAWVILVLCWVVLHWRMGLHAPNRFDRFALAPPVRDDFHGSSAAMAWLQQHVANEPARVAGLRLNLVAGTSGFYGLEGISGADPLTQGRYQELSQAAGLSQKNQWDWQFDAAGWERNRRFYDLLNVKYLVTRESVPPTSSLQLQTRADLDVYASPTVWPRAFFTDAVVPYDGLEQFVRLVRDGDGRPFAAVPRSDVAAWNGLVSSRLSATRVTVPATNYVLGFNFTEFAVTNDRPGVVVLTETDRERDFIVSVDGQRVSRFGVNHAFKAVRLETPGTHRLRFTYRPHFWIASLIAAAVGLVLFAVTGEWLRRQPVAANP